MPVPMFHRVVWMCVAWLTPKCVLNLWPHAKVVFPIGLPCFSCLSLATSMATSMAMPKNKIIPTRFFIYGYIMLHP